MSSAPPRARRFSFSFPFSRLAFLQALHALRTFHMAAAKLTSVTMPPSTASPSFHHDHEEQVWPAHPEKHTHLPLVPHCPLVPYAGTHVMATTGACATVEFMPYPLVATTSRVYDSVGDSPVTTADSACGGTTSCHRDGTGVTT